MAEPILKYQSGEEIRKGDHVLFHEEPGLIEFVAIHVTDSENGWYVTEFGGGIMISDKVAGLTFLPASEIGEEDLEFVRRAEERPLEN